MRDLTPHKTPWISESLASLLRMRARELSGLILAFLAGMMALMLISFEPLDPSPNTAAAGSASNLLGEPGAWMADVLFQTWGQAAWLLSFGLFMTGYRYMRHVSPQRSRWQRALWFVLALILISTGGAFIAPDAPGGAVGWIVRHGWSLTTPGADVPFVAVPLGLFFGILGVLCFLFAMEIPPRSVVRGVDTRMRRLLYHGRALRRRKAMLAWTTQDSAAAPESVPHEPFFGTPPADLSPLSEGDDLEPLPFQRSHSQNDVPPASRVEHKRDAAARVAAPVKKSKATNSATKALLPPLDLLEKAPPSVKITAPREDRARELESVLEDFGIRGKIVKVRPGPVVTLYELEPAAGIKSSRVISLADDIARSMSAVSARVAIVPGRNVIGIELPNLSREKVYLRQLLESSDYTDSAAHLALMLGKDIEGNPVLADLARMPHLLLAGTTGSGKSVAINTMILSFLFRLPPDRCKFIMIDPKMLELSVYDGIPHLLAPVVTDPRKAVTALKWVVREMEDRYRAMSTIGVRNIEGYNQRLRDAVDRGETLSRKVHTGFDPETGKPIIEHQNLDMRPLPFIVVIVDEMADLMLVAGKDIENAVQRLAQMARAAGIHLIMATQRPSVDVITGTIKANFPSRISFHVTSKIDSRTILGEQGAEQLLGQGDMLYMASASRITRVHGPFVTDREIEAVVHYLKTLDVTAETIDITQDDGEGNASGDGTEGSGADALYDQAVDLVCRERKASTSYLQRHFQIGYNRAARMIDRMEADGVISGANAVGRRDVLAPARRGLS